MPAGRCECGGVAFEVKDLRREVTACHCSQCRRSSGHVWASTVAAQKDVRFTAQDTLAWYDSSEFAKRGFCTHCGSSLFYVMHAEPEVLAIAAGCIDAPSALQLSKHIFVKDKGDYYDIADGAEQIDKY